MLGKLNRFAVTGWTIAIALLIGHAMEISAANAQVSGIVFPAQQVSLDVLPLPEHIHLAAAHTDAEGAMARATSNDPDCPVTARTEVGPGAVIMMRLTAPCQRTERVNLHHNGLMFTEMTDENGRLNIEIPALSQNAVVIAEFPNGAGTVAAAQVDDLVNYDRVAVQWAGKSEFEIHALEFGGQYGGPGHVWSGNRPADGSVPTGGDVVRLGSGNALLPRRAEVYTYPSGSAARSGVIELSIEAEVTTANCGREVNAQTIQVNGSQMLRSRDVILSVPSCDTVGDYLVLTDVIDDLVITRR